MQIQRSDSHLLSPGLTAERSSRSQLLLGFGSGWWGVHRRLLLVSICSRVWGACAKVLPGSCVWAAMLSWLRACFLLVPWGADGENDVWEQTDTQSPWVIPGSPSVFFCLPAWDANIMNFNWKKKKSFGGSIFSDGGRINYRIIHGLFAALENSTDLNNVCLYIQIVCVSLHILNVWLLHIKEQVLIVEYWNTCHFGFNSLLLLWISHRFSLGYFSYLQLFLA